MKTLLFILLIFSISSCDLKSANHYIKKAAEFEEQGKYAEAIPLLDKAIAKQPENVAAHFNRAFDKYSIGDFEGSLSDYSTLININPKNTLAFFYRGNVKLYTEDFQGAIDDYNRALETKGGGPIYIEMTMHYNDEIDLNVSLNEILFQRGLAFIDLGKYNEAFQDFSHCLENNFERGPSHYNIGLIYIYNEMYEEACVSFNKAKLFGQSNSKKMIDNYCKDEL